MTAQRIADRYEVVRLLGEGPLGKVYHVRDHERAHEGAPEGAEETDSGEATLKILRADALDYEDLERKIEAWRDRMLELDHPRLNPLEHVGQTPLGLLYLASGYRQGENLRSLLERRGALPPERVLIIGRQMLEGLAAAHDEGVVHGNLHPGNVLLIARVPCTRTDPFGTGVLLLDHGLYELVGTPPPEANAAYQAPELAGLKGGATPATDVFAAAAILRELLVGTNSDAPIPALLAAPLERAMAAHPEQRYRDAAAFLAALPATMVASDGGDSPSAPDEVVAVALATVAQRDAELEAREKEVSVLAERAEETDRMLSEALSSKFEKLAQRDATIDALRAELDAQVAQAAPADEAAQEDPVSTATSSGRGGYTLAAAFAILAVAMTALWWRDRGEGETLAAPSSALAEAERRAGAAETALEQAAQDHQADLAATRGGYEAALLEAAQAHEAALADRDATLALATEEVETWKESERTWREDAGRLQDELDAARAEFAQGAGALEARLGELEEARGRISAAEEELARARDPELLALDQLDRVLNAIEARDGEAARARRAGLAATWPDLPGLGVVKVLADATFELGRMAEETDAQALLQWLGAATASLEEARTDLAQLAESAWVRREGGRRASAIRDTYAQLDRRAGEERAALTTRLEARWRAILLENPDTDPAEVLAIAEWFGDGRLSDFLDWYASFLQEATERGSMLELPELLKLRHLEAWGDVLAQRTDLLDLRGELGAREILLFRFARAWRGTPADEPPPALPVFFQDRDGSAPGVGWRHDLALRAGLGRADAAWPGGRGGRFVYLTTATVDGEDAHTWQVDLVVSAAAEAWTVRRSYFRADGSPLGSHDVELTRAGRRFTEVGRPGGPILDLTSERARPALWTSASGDEIPPPELVEPDDWDAFRAALGTAPVDALAYESGGVTGWYSAEWGCLAMESPGSFRRELVFAQPVRP